jgi:large subunit ribosomal protein L7/L12
MAKQPTPRLEKLKEKREIINARIQAIEARMKSSERKKDVRKKILIGSYYLDKAIKNDNMEDIKVIMDKFLIRNSDRILFGLEPLLDKA